MALSTGDSYPTTALTGLATAVRLAAFVQLPSHDLSISNEWEANLDHLALHLLWLCADGIDVINDVSVKAPSSDVFASQTIKRFELNNAARFAAAWMDLKFVTRVFTAVKKTHPKLTWLESDTMLVQAKGGADFPAELQISKCRSFAWYATEAHTDRGQP